MKLKKIRVATRDSQLALWQTNHVIDLIKSKYPDIICEVISLKSQADKVLDISLNSLGKKEGKGLFTKELDNALFDYQADIAVHSLKDIPTEIDSKLSIISILKRHDYSDAFISNTKYTYQSLDELPFKATIATGSLRRRSQLLKYRPDLNIVPLRGNLNTRCRKLDESDWSGIILASAGIERLQWSSKISFKIPNTIMLPAAGQGSVAIMARTEDILIKEICNVFQDTSSYIMAIAERAFLRKTEGGCSAPVAVLCKHNTYDCTIEIDGFIGSLDGKTIIQKKIISNDSLAEQSGKDLADEMLKIGGLKILEAVKKIII